MAGLEHRQTEDRKAHEDVLMARKEIMKGQARMVAIKRENLYKEIGQLKKSDRL